MYVPKEILNVYKNEVIHLTDILTPNEYELEWVKLYLIIYYYMSPF
jgi:pyridoxal/pyridoxine/pyridoxamine kinase